MATITLSLTGNVDGLNQTVSKSGTIDDQYLPYFFNCYGAKFGTIQGTQESTFDSFAMDVANKAAAEVSDFVRQSISIPTIVVTPQ